MKIKPGSKWRTRSGDIVKILRVFEDAEAQYPYEVYGEFVDSSETDTWMSDGKYVQQCPEHDCDLIGEI